MLEKLVYVRKVIGQNKVEFNCYKLRTMQENHQNSDMSPENFNQYGHPESDRYVTGFKRFLRVTGIDELPQIINILRGDMRPVGIRPTVKEFWKMVPEDLRENALRHKPGFFGIQYSYVGDGNFETYVENLRNYLSEKAKNPVLTDLKYFFIIFFNKIFRGVRSS